MTDKPPPGEPPPRTDEPSTERRTPNRPMGRVGTAKTPPTPAGPTTEDLPSLSRGEAQVDLAAQGEDTSPQAGEEEHPPVEGTAAGEVQRSGGASGDAPPERRPAAEPTPPAARPSWWRRAAPDAPSMEGPSHLAHHLGYEVCQAVVVAATLSALAYLVLGGQFSDLYMRVRGPAPLSDQVSLLTIGDEALYLWNPEEPQPAVTPRALLAEMVRFLEAAEARVVVLDILLDRPEAGDALLAEAARSHGTVVGAERFALTDPGTGREFAAALSPSLGDALESGFANLQEEEPTLFDDGDLLVRKAPLVRRLSRARLEGPFPSNLLGGEQADGEIRPSLALLAAWLHAGGRRADQTHELTTLLQSRCTATPLDCPIEASELGLPALPVPLAEPLSINFRGPEYGGQLPTVRAAEALRVMGQDALMRSMGVEMPVEIPEDLGALLRDRVVVVCRVDAHAQDRFVTPYSFPLMRNADMAGGRIQAQLIDTLLAGRHVRPVGIWVSLLTTALLLAGVWFTRRLLRDDVHSALWVVACLALVVAGAALFDITDGVVFPLGLPLAATLCALVLLRVHGWVREG